MNRYYLSSLAIFLLVWLGSVLSRSYGWYNDIWYADIILHTMSGVMFALFWYGLSLGKISSYFVLLFGALATAVLGSFLWECWEYWGYLLKPDFARFYIPDIADTLSDMASGLAGALLTSPFIKKLVILK